MRRFRLGPYREEEQYLPPYMRPPRPPRRVPLIHIVLFAATFLTTASAGALQMGANPFSDPLSISAGFPFAVTLMSILLVHELGHYFLSKYHRVHATLPYFIPGPPVFIGTFGAFIRMKSPPETRRALFDVGAAGPWAGVLLAIPAVIIGLQFSEIHTTPGIEEGLVLGDSLLFSFLTHLTLGVTPDDVTIILHPIAFAGWVGFFVTFLNLLPIGQLDGGHVAYAMLGSAHRLVARLFIGVILALGFLGGWSGWFFWAILIALLGLDHPPTLDRYRPLDRKRRIAAWMTVGVFVLTFMPTPLSLTEPPQRFEGEMTPVRAEVLHPARHGLRLVVPLRWKAARREIPA